MNEGVLWTYLSLEEIVGKLAEQGIELSTFVERRLLQAHEISKRKMQKTGTIEEVPHRDEQLENIGQLVEEFARQGQVVTSIDTKKKETLGQLFRPGEVYAEQSLKVFDHDFVSLQEGLVVLHGIYDIVRNEALINLGDSKDTDEFVFDSLLLWWQQHGQIHYPNAKQGLLLCDGGGSNNCRHYVFKEAIQKLANTIGVAIGVAHYPTYCSKYNPIEHRVFPHVTKALDGEVLDSAQTVKELIETRAGTKTGLKVFANVIGKTYEKGKKAAQEFLDKFPIIFDETLPKWNYQAIPID